MLAKYFSKDLLAINQVLKHPIDHESILDCVKIGIYFDDNAVNTNEGTIGVELTVRLLSRLYPTIHIHALNVAGKKLQQEMKNLAMEINSLITLDDSDDNIDIALVIGHTR